MPYTSCDFDGDISVRTMTEREYRRMIDRMLKPSYVTSTFYSPRTGFNKYAPKKIIYNGKATIVFWVDGTKTIVKKAEGEPYNRYNAFCAALAKKVFGNNSVVNRFVKSGIEQK